MLRVGPFLATFDPHDDGRYLNYAIPDDDARPTAGDVADLAAAYEERGRIPRLEYLTTAAPLVEAALADGGFVAEAHLSLMTCTPGRAAERRLPWARVSRAEDDAELEEMVAVQHTAFGDVPPDASTLARARAWVEAGAIAVVARDRATRAVIGGGVATPPCEDASELTGIAVRESFRRRGVAGAVTARLAREAFAAGAGTAFLTPGGDGAQRVYARAGFADASVMLHISRLDG
ncbi:GNAT family N-acetyltransferase [Baekduia soli]|uniref:GNAT family N-acetyltransferase n=1 Tax=Baekduia soli TaxID=496014 RepID=A0A5B8U6Z6_9ACTN|nr:GNAT family N-acetyltransferase [Baekduia soli]QEC48685.1 GNAT family N-acetyltransferase [Baekduia soli]